MSKILIDEATVKLALEALRSMANTLAEHQEPTTFYEDEAMRALKALAEQPAQQEPVAWPIETNNQVEALAKQCGWDNRRYMTPADYQIWCDRMREFVQLATPQAQSKPLTDQEIDDMSRTMVKGSKSVNWLCRAIEAAHGIKENQS